MITQYIAKLLVRFNPLGKEAKTARLILSAIPPTQRLQGTQIQNEVLASNSTKIPTVKVTFKDKTEMEVDPRKLSFQEVSSIFDRHSRKLSLKESVENS